MAQLTRRRTRKIPELELALCGNIEAHQRLVLRLQLGRIKAAEAELAPLEEGRRGLEPRRPRAGTSPFAPLARRDGQ
jgi:hypothetical protein